MPYAIGYVGTIEAQVAGEERLWFMLTSTPQGDRPLRLGHAYAWFTFEEPSLGGRVRVSPLAILTTALRMELPIRIEHDAACRHLHKEEPFDTFVVSALRLLPPSTTEAAHG